MNNFLTEDDIKIWKHYTENLLQNESHIKPKYIFDREFSRKLDLHGYPIHTAWHLFKDFIDQHFNIGTKSVVVITGKSGQMAIEFKEWCRLNKSVKKYEPINTKNGTAGSYRITLMD